VEEKLRGIMRNIHDTCLKYGSEGSAVNYVKGANIGGFARLAEAMLGQGVF
jgi:glutamate dehydrogenase (NADP+)